MTNNLGLQDCSFTDPMKHFNPPLVASATGEESQHNILGLSIFWGNQQSVMSSRSTPHPECFHGLTHINKLPLLQPPPCSKSFSSSSSQLRTSLPSSHSSPSSSSSRPTCLQYILFKTTAVKFIGPSQDHPYLLKNN